MVYDYTADSDNIYLTTHYVVRKMYSSAGSDRLVGYRLTRKGNFYDTVYSFELWRYDGNTRWALQAAIAKCNEYEKGMVHNG